MTAQNKKRIIVAFLLADAALLILGIMNFRLFRDKAGLPEKYESVVEDFSFRQDGSYYQQKIIEIEGKGVESRAAIDFLLLSYRYNDTVKIKSADSSGNISSERIALPRKYGALDLQIMAMVALFYFITGIFVLLKYRNTSFAYIVHSLTIAVGAMIIFEWGNVITYNSVINFINYWLFEISIYLAPTFFLHFSFVYPVKAKENQLVFLTPFYYATLTFITISTIHLVKIFFLGADPAGMYFLTFHTTVSDVYLAIVLILTIAKLEHSALTLTHAHYKKQVYWVLLGIMFGPLIYMFLFLIPRILMGYELVSSAFMQFTVVIAPVTLLISITGRRQHH
ncbi:MAG: hypothetical protein HUU54_16485 [Ignavibacteriaceae bacterium]|nr:hypothetical protein [Ignavibacteriaceae bacterium]